MRVLVAGMGSAIGTNIALRAAEDPAVEALAGFDLEPPRRWIPKADFQFARPRDAARVSEIVARFKPTVVVHAWVFEPRARSSPGQARSRTIAGTEALLGACGQIDTVEHFVARSSTSIYGRGRTAAARPTVETAVRPTSTFGEIVARVEDRVEAVAADLGASCAMVRVAPVMASNLPNPLGRFLLLPIVPVPVTSRRFGVAHLGDVARVIAQSAIQQVSGPINVMAADPITPMGAVTIGRRPAVPVLPIAFRAGRLLGELPGTPIPEHVAELLSRGGVVEPTDTEALLGHRLRKTTPDAIRDLYGAGRLIDIDVERLVGAR
jgi:nucleoside-diphosphate-sugar epimerase